MHLPFIVMTSCLDPPKSSPLADVKHLDLLRNHDNCSATVTLGFPSREGCTMPQPVVFFMVPRPALSTFMMPDDPLFSTTNISGELLVSSGNIRCNGDRVLNSDSRHLTETIAIRHARWRKHVLRVPAHRVPVRTQFTRSGQGWKKWCGGQADLT